MTTQGNQLPVKHMLCFLLTVFICSFLFAYQYIESSNYCLSSSYSIPYPDSTVEVQDMPKQVNSAHMEFTTMKMLHSDNHSSTDYLKSINSVSSSYWKASTFNGCCLPNAIIIGAKKAGTRALINFLKFHPEVTAAPNEVHFFDRDENYSRGLQWYANKLDAETKTKVLLEKSPYYFIDYDTPEKILAYNSSVRLILLVRNPVRRVLSDQTQLFRNSGGTTPTLEEKIFLDTSKKAIDIKANILQPSLYVKFLSHWFQWFPKMQIHIVNGDNLIKENPYHEMKPLEKFLNLSPFYTPDKFVFSESKGFYCPVMPSGTLKCLGATKGKKHLDFDQSTIDKLSEFFQPYNEQFYTLVGKDFNWS